MYMLVNSAMSCSQYAPLCSNRSGRGFVEDLVLQLDAVDRLRARISWNEILAVSLMAMISGSLASVSTSLRVLVGSM